MHILLTGASSKIGRLLSHKLIHILTDLKLKEKSPPPKLFKLVCVGRNLQTLKSLQNSLPLELQNSLELCQQDLTEDFFSENSPLNKSTKNYEIDWVIHMAAVTHSPNGREYLIANYESTMRLAIWAQKHNINNFCFVSSQTASDQSGDYGLSKLLAERGLLQFDWQRLLILRPSEIKGLGGNEGLDQFEILADRWKIYPVLLTKNGSPAIFHPLSAEKLISAMISLLLKLPNSIGLKSDPVANPSPKIEIWNIRGQRLTAWDIFNELRRRSFLVPLPIYLPFVDFAFRVLQAIAPNRIVHDQVERLLGPRLQSPFANRWKVYDLEVFDDKKN